MSNYSLPLFMQVKANAVTDLNKNLNLYMPKLVFAKTLILTTEGLLQTLDRKVKIPVSYTHLTLPTILRV